MTKVKAQLLTVSDDPEGLKVDGFARIVWSIRCCNSCSVFFLMGNAEKRDAVAAVASVRL